MAYGSASIDTFNTSTGQTFSPASGSATMKNRLINADMRIDQRAAGGSFTPTSTGARTYGTCDRWGAYITVASKFSMQQNAGSVTPPPGFTNYLGITSSSAYSVVSTDLNLLQQPIEAFNTADLAWGTANAKTITLSFWVYSSLTGTFGGSIVGGLSYPFSYTINTANTWQYVTITIPGPTTGSWQGSTNNVGVFVSFGLGVGSSNIGPAGAWSSSGYWSATGATNIIATSGATFYITGVQLEQGSVASAFDFRHYGVELALCQRYYRTSFPYGTAPAQNTGVQQGALVCQSPGTLNNTVAAMVFASPLMRANPNTITYYNPNAANANWRNTSTNSDGSATGQINGSSTGWLVFMNGAASGGGNTYQIHYSADAEL